MFCTLHFHPVLYRSFDVVLVVRMRVSGWPCRQPSLRRAAETDPHPGYVAGCVRQRCVRVFTRCTTPAVARRGSRAKSSHLNAGGAWRAALTKRTPARERTPAQPVGMGSHADSRHPA